MHPSCLTPSELIEISLIDCFPKDYQITKLKGLLDKCDRQHPRNPNYSRKFLESLPTAQAIYLASQYVTTTKSAIAQSPSSNRDHR